MILAVDRASAVFPYLQLAAQLREAIISGELTERVPSALSVSQEAGVAMFTARRALMVLKDEGYCYFAVGMGTYVADRSKWPQS